MPYNYLHLLNDHCSITVVFLRTIEKLYKKIHESYYLLFFNRLLVFMVGRMIPGSVPKFVRTETILLK